MSYCIKCGKEIVEGSVFCKNCGTKVVQNKIDSLDGRMEFVGKVKKCPNCGEIISGMCSFLEYIFNSCKAVSQGDFSPTLFPLILAQVLRKHIFFQERILFYVTKSNTAGLRASTYY